MLARMPVHYSLRLDPQPLGTVRAQCAHCNRQVAMTRHRIVGLVQGAAVPSGEALLCPACRKASRQEGPLSRIVSAAFLVPFLLVLCAAVGAGAYFIGSMLLSGDVTAGFLAAGMALMAVPGYLAWRVLLLLRRLLSGSRLLRLQNLHTAI